MLDLCVPYEDCLSGAHEYPPGATGCVYCEFSPVGLHIVRGRNRYCGPAAVSAITGCTTDEAARLMRQRSGRRAIKGAYHYEVTAALRALGFGFRRRMDLEATAAPPRGKRGRRDMSLGTLVDRFPGFFDRTRAVLIAVTWLRRGRRVGHYLAISGAWWVDNWTRVPQPVASLSGAERSRRVDAVWAVERRT